MFLLKINYLSIYVQQRKPELSLMTFSIHPPLPFDTFFFQSLKVQLMQESLRRIIETEESRMGEISYILKAALFRMLKLNHFIIILLKKEGLLAIDCLIFCLLHISVSTP